MKTADMPKPVPFPPLPEELFSIISMDWAWPYNDRKGCDPKLGGFQYPPVPIERAADLPLGSIMTDPCAVFMWVTGPMAAQGAHVKLANLLGLQPVSMPLVWVKTNPSVDVSKPLLATQEKGGGIRSGQGHSTCGNVEMCFLCWPSKKRLPRASKSVKQLIFAPVTAHSAKPPEALRRMVALYGDLPRLEMFSRRPGPGWATWGYNP